MCRLLGVVSRKPEAVSELVADDLGPFLALAGEHRDGWGVASVAPDGAVASVKEPTRADTSAGFDRAVRVTTDAALLHLRMASPQSPVVPANTHPFGDRHLAFAHNGDFHPVDCLDAVSGPASGGPLSAAAEGGTDSERFYLRIRRYLDDGAPPHKAIPAAAAEVKSLAEGFASLNCLLLTPDALYAYTAHDPHSDVIRRRGPGYFALSYHTGPDKVVVASTGWPQDPPAWSVLPEDHVLEIRRGDARTVVHAG